MGTRHSSSTKMVEHFDFTVQVKFSSLRSNAGKTSRKSIFLKKFYGVTNVLRKILWQVFQQATKVLFHLISQIWRITLTTFVFLTLYQLLLSLNSTLLGNLPSEFIVALLTMLVGVALNRNM